MGVFLFSGCTTTDLADPPEEKNGLAQKKSREALQFGSLNQKNEMMKALKESIELNPNDASSYFFLGREYFWAEILTKLNRNFLKVSS